METSQEGGDCPVLELVAILGWILHTLLLLQTFVPV